MPTSSDDETGVFKLQMLIPHKMLTSNFIFVVTFLFHFYFRNKKWKLKKFLIGDKDNAAGSV
jgi:hypothetical protein